MQALPTLALALLIFAPSALAAQQAERYTLEGDDIAIYNLAGALTVEPGTGSVTRTVSSDRAASDTSDMIEAKRMANSIRRSSERSSNTSTRSPSGT